MSEEDVKDDIIEEKGETTDEPEYSEIETQAMEKGWNPEGVEGKRNLSAEEFLDREEFYSQIHSLRRENKKLSEDVKNMAKYQKRVRDDERKKVIEELKAAKKLAYAAEDYDKIVEIDEQLAEARTPEPEETETDNSAAEAFQEWSSKNKWYTTDPEMRQYADLIGKGLFDPSIPPSEFYEKVEKEVKARFADKFASPTRRSTVESGTRTKPRTKTGLSEKNLSEEERSIMNTVLRNTPGMTKEKYLEDYEALIR